MLGSGAVIVMDETTDMVQIAAACFPILLPESCGNVPHAAKTGWLYRMVTHIVEGKGRPEDLSCWTAWPARSKDAPSALWAMLQPCRCAASSNTTATNLPYIEEHKRSMIAGATALADEPQNP